MAWTCSEACWTAVKCPTCGNYLNPRGRSVPLEATESNCCAEAKYSPINKRHLWDEHDSTRHYTDPVGWEAHEANCEHCKPLVGPREA